MARRLSPSLGLLAAGVALVVGLESAPAGTNEARKGGTLRMGSFEDVGPSTLRWATPRSRVDQPRDVREALQPP